MLDCSISVSLLNGFTIAMLPLVATPRESPFLVNLRVVHLSISTHTATLPTQSSMASSPNRAQVGPFHSLPKVAANWCFQRLFPVSASKVIIPLGIMSPRSLAAFAPRTSPKSLPLPVLGAHSTSLLEHSVPFRMERSSSMTPMTD